MKTKPKENHETLKKQGLFILKLVRTKQCIDYMRLSHGNLH